VAALHARAARPADTDWAGIDLLYATLERCSRPCDHAHRAVAVSKVTARGSPRMIEPLAPQLSGYFYSTGSGPRSYARSAAQRRRVGFHPGPRPRPHGRGSSSYPDASGPARNIQLMANLLSRCRIATVWFVLGAEPLRLWHQLEKGEIE